MLKVCQLRDLRGIGADMLNRNTRSVLKTLVAAAQDNYPETMAHVIFVNTPTLFRFISGLIRPLLHKRTLDKFMVLGADYKRGIFELVDTATLKAFVRMQQGANARRLGSHRIVAGSEDGDGA